MDTQNKVYLRKENSNYWQILVQLFEKFKFIALQIYLSIDANLNFSNSPLSPVSSLIMSIKESFNSNTKTK